jgi:hypothetical protein
MRQRGLADARHVFDQQMPAGQQAGDAVVDLPRLADNDGADLGFQRGQPRLQGGAHHSEGTIAQNRRSNRLGP